MTDTDLLSSPDLRALFAAVEASPTDGLPKLVVADWLDEHGEHSLAFAFRWAARWGKWPLRTSLSKGASWDWGFKGAWVCPDHALLPDVFDNKVGLSQGRYKHTRHDSALDAFFALADALQRVRDVLEV